MGRDGIPIITNRQNPFLFPLIINQTLNTSDFTTLKRSRLVCKVWEEEANKFLRIKTQPIIISRLTESRSQPTVENEVIEFFPTNTSKSNVIIDKEIGPEFFPLVKTSLQNITSTCLIKYLEIQNAPWTTFQLNQIFQLLPHLEELTLSENFILPKLDHEQQPNSQLQLGNLHSLHFNLKDEYLQNLANIEFLIKLYKMGPNLQEITCWKTPFSSPAENYATIFSKLLFRSIVHSSSQTLNNSLSHMDINVDLRDDDIDLLNGSNLELKTLHLPLDSSISFIMIDNLLQTLSPSLRRLKLTYRNCLVQMPLLENLRKLEYFAIHRCISDVPNLRKCHKFEKVREFLGVNNYQDLDLEQTIHYTVAVSLFPCSSTEDGRFRPLTNLKELILDSVYYMPSDVFNLKPMFPNLIRLKISFLNDDLLREIFKGFPRLESLSVKDGFFTDSGLTGISPEVLEVLGNCGKKFKNEMLREFPSILDMPELQQLELTSIRVTDFGVINGLALCTSVQELTLDFSQMGDTALLKLTEEMNLDTLCIKSSPKLSEEIIQNIQGKMGRGCFKILK